MPQWEGALFILHNVLSFEVLFSYFVLFFRLPILSKVLRNTPLSYFFSPVLSCPQSFVVPQECVSFPLWKMVILSLQEKYTCKVTPCELSVMEAMDFKMVGIALCAQKEAGLLLPNAGSSVSIVPSGSRRGGDYFTEDDQELHTRFIRISITMHSSSLRFLVINF